jgi:hypothetical protein
VEAHSGVGGAAIVCLIRREAQHRVALDPKRLQKAIKAAAAGEYDVFHISCHGDHEGIRLADETDLSWSQLAEFFQEAQWAPKALVMSSCVGGDKNIASAFKDCSPRPEVIFGAEANDDDDLLSFSGACVSWSILYGLLADHGMDRATFKDAVTKMNFVTRHRFVYRRWDGKQYRRYPNR